MWVSEDHPDSWGSQALLDHFVGLLLHVLRCQLQPGGDSVTWGQAFPGSVHATHDGGGLVPKEREMLSTLGFADRLDAKCCPKAYSEDFALSNWKEEFSIYWIRAEQFWRKDQGFGLVYVSFATPIRHLSWDVEQAIGYMSQVSGKAFARCITGEYSRYW